MPTRNSDKAPAVDPFKDLPQAPAPVAAVAAPTPMPAPVYAPQAPATFAQNLRAQAQRNVLAERQLHDRLRNAPKVQVSIAPQYRPFFGEVMPVALNGVLVYVPCDGRPRSIPKPFARIVHQRLHTVNAFLLKKDQMANVTQNFEKFPGEIKF